MQESDFVGPAKRLADTDLPRIGKTVLGVGEDEIHALITVETSGHGFDSKNRPIILYEPHIFYRLTSGAERAEAVAKGIAYERWGEKPYPSEEGSYQRLFSALQINQSAALMGCSWGLGQILGENHKLCGYGSPEEMVRDMVLGETQQLAAMCTFIKARKLDAALRDHDWAAVARGYNGPRYAENHYDTRLAAAFAKWQKIPDTPWREEAAKETEQYAPPKAPPAVQANEIEEIFHAVAERVDIVRRIGALFGAT